MILAKTRNEMVQEFGMLSLIPCASYSETLYGISITWPTGHYDEGVVSSTLCPVTGSGNGNAAGEGRGAYDDTVGGTYTGKGGGNDTGRGAGNGVGNAAD